MYGPDDIPLNTRELIPWLRRRFPELSPRCHDDVPKALVRGAQLELLDYIELSLERITEED